MESKSVSYGSVIAVAMALTLSACSSLPTAGPSAEDVVSHAVTPQEQRYEVLDINADIVAILSRRTQDSLLATFGDYRPSVDPQIGIGDVITVTIWEAAAGGLFSAPLVTDRFSTGSKSATIPEQVVGRDGSITVPYAGRVRVIGQSLNQVQRTIERALEGKAIQPQVLVNITKPISKTVTVTGEVTAGARVPLSVKGDRLLEVVALAGGVRAPVNETFIQLSRGNRTVRVSMSRVVKDPRENIYMRPNDVLTLVREPQKFVAYGATGRNADVPFESESITLSEALAKAGGLLDFRADPAGVFVLRYESVAIARALVPNSSLLTRNARVPIVYRLNLRDANGLFLAQRFKIFAKDVVYVSNAPANEWQKALQLFYMLTGPVTTGVSTGASVVSVTR